MLFFSQGVVRIRRDGAIELKGVLQSCASDVRDFFRDLDLHGVTIKYRNGAFRFSRQIDESTRQRIRNFLVNLPALKKLR